MCARVEGKQEYKVYTQWAFICVFSTSVGVFTLQAGLIRGEETNDCRLNNGMAFQKMDLKP